MITLITGQRNIGKTTWLEHRIMNIDEVGGFLSPKRFVEGEFEGYDIYDVATGDVHPLLHYLPLKDDQVEDGKRIGPFVIDQEGLCSATKIIEKARQNVNCHTIVLDEIGMAEVEGRLFRGVLDSCMEWHDTYEKSDGISSERSLLIVVQERALECLKALYGNLDEAEIIRK